VGFAEFGNGGVAPMLGLDISFFCPARETCRGLTRSEKNKRRARSEPNPAKAWTRSRQSKNLEAHIFVRLLVETARPPNIRQARAKPGSKRRNIPTYFGFS
jgi:hypothetical protein